MGVTDDGQKAQLTFLWIILCAVSLRCVVSGVLDGASFSARLMDSWRISYVMDTKNRAFLWTLYLGLRAQRYCRNYLCSCTCI
jgi:hypothetical protein